MSYLSKTNNINNIYIICIQIPICFSLFFFEERLINKSSSAPESRGFEPIPWMDDKYGWCTTYSWCFDGALYVPECIIGRTWATICIHMSNSNRVKINACIRFYGLIITQTIFELGSGSCRSTIRSTCELGGFGLWSGVDECIKKRVGLQGHDSVCRMQP